MTAYAHLDILKYLCGCEGAGINAANNVRKARIVLLKLILLRDSRHFNSFNNQNGETALLMASKEFSRFDGQLEVIQCLCEYGANVDAADHVRNKYDSYSYFDTVVVYGQFVRRYGVLIDTHCTVLCI